MIDLHRIQQVLADCHRETARRVMGDEPDGRFDAIFDSLLDLGDDLAADEPGTRDTSRSGLTAVSGQQGAPEASSRRHYRTPMDEYLDNVG